MLIKALLIILFVLLSLAIWLESTLCLAQTWARYLCWPKPDFCCDFFRLHFDLTWELLVVGCGSRQVLYKEYWMHNIFLYIFFFVDHKVSFYQINCRDKYLEIAQIKKFPQYFTLKCQQRLSHQAFLHSFFKLYINMSNQSVFVLNGTFWAQKVLNVSCNGSTQILKYLDVLKIKLTQYFN